VVNDYVLSVILGIVEGLTEFVPVSSTAHLRIAQALLGLDLSDGYWKMFAIVIQLGAIACLPIYFRKRILDFLRGLPGEHGILRHPLVLTMFAFVCTAVPSLLMIKLIGKHLESLVIMSAALIIGGVVMMAVDMLSASGKPPIRIRRMEEMGLAQAVWIGLCQTLSAIFPGTSRSMSTIAAGQVVGMTRTAALEFSFFLSMPTMLAATGYDLLKVIRARATAPLSEAVLMTPHAWSLLAVGFVVSFVVAYGVVAWFMRWVRVGGFTPFALYRIAVGAAVLAWALRGVSI
jgi:undecaprenyl-diphosphatase